MQWLIIAVQMRAEFRISDPRTIAGRLDPGHAEASSMATAELTTMPATIEQLLFVIDLDQRFMPLLLAYGLHFMTDAHTYSGRRHEPKACFNNCGSIMVHTRSGTCAMRKAMPSSRTLRLYLFVMLGSSMPMAW